MGIEHEVTPTLMELKDRIVSLETKLAVYEQGTDDADVKEAMEDTRIDCSAGDCYAHIVTLRSALRAERAKVAELTQALARGEGFPAYKSWIDRAESTEARLKAQGEALAAAEKSFTAIFRKTKRFVSGNLWTVKRDAEEGLSALAKLREAAKEGA